MPPLGLPHFAEHSPHHLALAAPDGRHWSRGELWDAVNAHGDNTREVEGIDELVAALAGDDVSDLAQARHIMEQTQLAPESDNTHLCGHPLRADGVMACAVACAQYGHALVLEAKFAARGFLRAVQRYRVTSTVMSADDASGLLQLSRAEPQAQALSSLRVIWMIGERWSPDLRRSVAELCPNCQLLDAPHR
jgi:hypothetical protein